MKTRTSRLVFVASLALSLSAVLPPAATLTADDADVDEFGYNRVVDILKASTVSPKKKKGKPAIELTFNLHPSLPKGAKVEFVLLYRFLPFESAYYTLKSENRKNLTFSWKPKKRCPVDTYQLRTLLPLKLQSAVVQRELKKRSNAFPAKEEPWPWNYPKLPLKIGSEAELKAEEVATKKYFADKVFAILGYNNEFVSEHLEPLVAGEKYVSNGRVDVEALGTYVDSWMKKMGELQLAVVEYEKKQPGLFSKNEPAHFHLWRLSRLVAKRCYAKLTKALGEYDTSVADLKLKGHVGFNRSETGRVTAGVLEKVFNQINALVAFAEEEEEEGEGEG